MKIKILLILFFLTISCSSHSVDEIHLIPSNFRGVVTIIFDSTKTEAEYEDNKRIYRIPESGILNQGGSFSKEFHKESFYFVDEFGNRKIIQQNINNENNNDSNEVIIWGNISGSFIKANNNSKTHLIQYIVTNKHDLEYYLNMRNNMNFENKNN